MRLSPKASKVIDRQDLRRVVCTLGYGAAGGAVFYWFNMPLAWMMGAMVLTTIMSMTGRRLYVPQSLRATMVMVLGVLLGSAFTPDVIEQASRWPITLSALLVYIALITAVLYLYFHKVLGYDPVTAYFSATPGGLNEMVIVGAAFRGDDRTIALIHGSRVLLVVLVIPFWFRYTEGIGAGVSFRGPSLLDNSMLDLGVLTLCAVVGAVGARLLRLPAYRIVGPMLATAAIHIAGWTESKPPYELVFIAQVVVGASVGARFAGVPLERVVRTIAASVGSTSVMLVFTFLAALVLAPLTGIPKAPIVLAFAPGGLAEMSVIALSLGIETAFVATHHVARIAMIVIGAPIVFRTARRLRKQKEVAPPPAE
jgi:membrane AbrB-like protein